MNVASRLILLIWEEAHASSYWAGGLTPFRLSWGGGPMPFRL
jgi:hypothetical protein